MGQIHWHNKKPQGIDLILGTKQKRYIDPGTAMIIAASISAGGGILGGMLGKEDVDTGWGEGELFRQLPDYPESEGARKNWWQTLQDWQSGGAYGATDMNWDEIFNTAKNRLSRYYWGGVNEPGLAGKMKASAARRNMPVNEAMIGSLGQSEAISLSDLMSDLNTQKSKYTESARNTWLSSLMNLSALKPSYVTRSGVTGGGQSYGLGNMIGDVSSGVGSLFAQYAKEKSMEELWNKLIKESGGASRTGLPETSQSNLLGTSDSELENIFASLN